MRDLQQPEKKFAKSNTLVTKVIEKKIVQILVFASLHISQAPFLFEKMVYHSYIFNIIINCNFYIFDSKNVWIISRSDKSSKKKTIPF